MLDVTVLGPLDVSARGQSVVPTAGKPRQVLALLALRADRVVPVPVLLEEVWGQRPPRSAMTTLQTYVLQLRRRLAAALPAGTAKKVLVTSHGGYLLTVGGGLVDATELERLAAEGDAAYEAGDPRRAASRYRAALEFWRGSPLVDVPQGPLLELEAVRLEETHRAVLERRIDVDLRLGRHTVLVPELRALVSQHPRHEGFSAQLILALHRSGGAAGALGEYHRLRTELVTDLGIEPSSRLRRLQQAVLTGQVEDVAAGVEQYGALAS